MKKIICVFTFIFSAALIMLSLSSCGTSSLAKIGMAKEDALALFKEDPPAYHSADEKKYYWYEDTFYDVFLKYDIDLKASDDQYALIVSSIEENEELALEISTLSFKFRYILFDDEDKLAEFYYDFDHRFDLTDDYSCFKAKTVKDLAFSKRKLEYYVEELGQFKNNKNKICYTAKIVNFENISYTINFEDGTIFKGKLSDAITNDTTYTVNTRSHHINMYIETGDFSFASVKPSEFKTTEILQNISYECRIPYAQAFQGIVETASFVGYIDKGRNLVYWDTKIDYLPDDVDKDSYLGELTEKTAGGIIYRGYSLNPYYEVVGVSNKDTRKLEFKEGVQIIRSGALCNLQNIYMIIIPDGVKTIEDGAICDNNNLVGVSIPTSVEEIGSANFNRCPKLLEIFNGSNVYNEQMAQQVLVNGAYYYDTYNTNTDMPYVEQVERALHLKAYSAKNNMVYIFIKLDNSGKDNLTTYKTGWYLITAIGSSTKINIPDGEIKIGDEKITEYSVFHNAFQNNKKITEVALGDSCKEIGDYAFERCINLKSVVAPSVESIGINAFNGCQVLESFTFDSVTALNDYAFYGCQSLKSVDIPNLVSEELEMEQFTFRIVCGVFSNCSSIETVNMPMLEKPASSMFADCTSLTTVNMPKLMFVRNLMFSNCANLETVNFGYFSIIESGAFYNCKKLKNVALSDSINYIEASAFDGCESLEFYVEDNYKYLSSESNKHIFLFDVVDKTTTECAILDDVKYINVRLFENLLNLTSLTVPNDIQFYNLREILRFTPNLEYYNENGMLYIGSVTNKYLALVMADKTIKNFTVKEDTRFIMDEAFMDSALESITIGNNVETIGYESFKNSKLKTIDLSEAFAGTDGRCFENCKELLSAKITNTCPNMFENCTKLEVVTHVYTSYVQYEAFKNCTSLTTVVIEEGDPIYSAEPSAYYNCKSLVNIDLSYLQRAYDSSFYGCTRLTNVDLRNVTNIDYRAFAKTNISTANLENITDIGGYAFENCTNLEVVTLGTNLTSIGEYAFSGCTKLRNLDLPNTLKTLGDAIFDKCSVLSKVMIPDSIFQYFLSVFRNSPTTDFYIKSSIEELETLGFRKSYLELNQHLYIYSETEPTDNEFDYWHYVNGEIVVWPKV